MATSPNSNEDVVGALSATEDRLSFIVCEIYPLRLFSNYKRSRWMSAASSYTYLSGGSNYQPGPI